MILGHEVIGKIVHSDQIYYEGQPVATPIEVSRSLQIPGSQHEETTVLKCVSLAAPCIFRMSMAVLPDLVPSIPFSAFPLAEPGRRKAMWPAEPLAAAIHAAYEVAIRKANASLSPALPYRLPDC